MKKACKIGIFVQPQLLLDQFGIGLFNYAILSSVANFPVKVTLHSLCADKQKTRSVSLCVG